MPTRKITLSIKPVERLKTIKELLQEWWGRNTTTRMPLPTFYTYEVQVDGQVIRIESTSRSRLWIQYKARKKYPNANRISVLRRSRSYATF